MTTDQLKQIFLDTDYPHTSGTPEELKAAEYLKACCEALGVPAHLESFQVAMADMEACSVTADGEDISCKAFYGCGKLKKVSGGTSVTKIGNQAFYGCKSLKKIVIPELVKKIGPQAFAFCEELEEVVFAERDSVDIAEDAFAWCDKL